MDNRGREGLSDGYLPTEEKADAGSTWYRREGDLISVLVTGDAFHEMELIRRFTLPETPGLIITSPPYNLDIKYANSEDALSWQDYLTWSFLWMRTAYRMSPAGTRFCLNIPLDSNKGGKQAVYVDLVIAAFRAGWKYHTTIIWNENNISRRTAWGSWRSATAPFVTAPVEMIVVFYKETWKRELPEGIDAHNIEAEEFKDLTLGLWTFNGERKAKFGHPAPFPEELPRRLITLYSFKGDWVLDPFVGSGTTSAAAWKLGRNSIGIDVSEEYVKIAKMRLESLDVPVS